jgi:hypothetical protein
MSTATALKLLDGIGDHPACDRGVRAQVAFVRALVDEIDRRQESRTGVTALNDQLDEESARLAQLLGNEVGAASRWDRPWIHARSSRISE